MSDEFERLVDIDVSLEDAPAAGKRLIERLRELKLISGGLNKKWVLGASGYQPGPGVPTSYQLGKGEYKFWELQVCGVEPLVGRHFNSWALGEACEGFVCPACGEGIDPFDEDFGAAFDEGLTKWSEQAGKAPVACPHCPQENRRNQVDLPSATRLRQSFVQLLELAATRFSVLESRYSRARQRNHWPYDGEDVWASLTSATVGPRSI